MSLISLISGVLLVLFIQSIMAFRLQTNLNTYETTYPSPHGVLMISVGNTTPYKIIGSLKYDDHCILGVDIPGCNIIDRIKDRSYGLTIALTPTYGTHNISFYINGIGQIASNNIIINEGITNMRVLITLYTVQGFQGFSNNIRCDFKINTNRTLYAL